jgi:hypothetical protein
VRYLEAAFNDIVEAFWNRKVFRAILAMFEGNPRLQDSEGAGSAKSWVADMYSSYAVMLVRRELDSQSQVLTLTRMLYEMEKHHDVLMAHAPGSAVPSVAEVRADREALQASTQNVVAFGHRIIAHRTSPGAVDITWGELDDALRELRNTLITYNRVLKASDIASTTPTPKFDWLAPYRVAWLPEGFEEPEAEEEARLSEAEKSARREHRRKWGFGP